MILICYHPKFDDTTLEQVIDSRFASRFLTLDSQTLPASDLAAFGMLTTPHFPQYIYPEDAGALTIVLAVGPQGYDSYTSFCSFMYPEVEPLAPNSHPGTLHPNPETRNPKPETKT